MPVRKVPWDGVSRRGGPGGDDLPFVYSGTLVVQGRGVARGRGDRPAHRDGQDRQGSPDPGTGEHASADGDPTPGAERWRSLGAALCIVLVVVYGLTRGDWLDGLLGGITLAMATLPEEFPVVLTIFLALGAWRISQERVLTRRMPAVETLGAATVLCVDKTGTLTLNRMAACASLRQGDGARPRSALKRASSRGAARAR